MRNTVQGIVECFYILEVFIKHASYASLIPFGWDVHLNNLSADAKIIVRNKFKEVDGRCIEWLTNAYRLLID